MFGKASISYERSFECERVLKRRTSVTYRGQVSNVDCTLEEGRKEERETHCAFRECLAREKTSPARLSFRDYAATVGAAAGKGGSALIIRTSRNPLAAMCRARDPNRF